MTNQEAINECLKIEAFAISEKQVEAMKVAIKALTALDKTDKMKQEIKLRSGLLDCIPDIMAIIDKYTNGEDE